MRYMIVVLLLGALTFGASAPTWVDSSHVLGTLIFAQEIRLGGGSVVCWGKATDPDGDLLDISLLSPPSGTAMSVDPNGSWQWTWTPTAIGVYYFALQAEELPSPYGGRRLNTLVTTAVRVLPENQPPVITPGGCTVR